jgi:hypothetical protein
LKKKLFHFKDSNSTNGSPNCILTSQQFHFNYDDSVLFVYIFLRPNSNNFIASILKPVLHQFVVEQGGNTGGPPRFRLGGNFGDYFIGPGLEQLIEQLAENDPNRYI